MSEKEINALAARLFAVHARKKTGLAADWSQAGIEERSLWRHVARAAVKSIRPPASKQARPPLLDIAVTLPKRRGGSKPSRPGAGVFARLRGGEPDEGLLKRTEQSRTANFDGVRAHWHPRKNRPLDGKSPETTLKRATELLRDPANFKAGKSPLWWVGVGTALGASRDGGFIPGDTDIDIRIGLDYRDVAGARAAAREVVALFEGHGFSLFRETSWDDRPMQTAFADDENNDVALDLYYFYSHLTEGCWVNYNRYGYREKPRALIDAMEEVGWPGREDIRINMPSPPEAYNAWRFGPEWRTPKKNSELTAVDNQCIRPLPNVTVLTYGTFDLFHYGHRRLLKRAKALGLRLVVVVVSDALCRVKGKKPVQNEAERVANVERTGLADLVVLQEQLDQKEADIEKFKVKTLVVGSDWTNHPRFEQVRGYRGVELVYLPRTWLISSSLKRRWSRLVGFSWNRA